jgi:hypothetical protein
MVENCFCNNNCPTDNENAAKYNSNVREIQSACTAIETDIQLTL